MMEIISRTVPEKLGGASYSWYRHQPSAGHVPGQVCKFWLAGNCTRNPCRFLHPDKVAPINSVNALNTLKAKQSHNALKPLKVISKRANEDQNLRKVKQRNFPENAVDNKGYKCGSTENPSVKCNDGGTQKSFVKTIDVGSTEKPSVEKKDVVVVKHRDCSTQKPSAVHNDGDPEKGKRKICEDWINKSCVNGGKCKYLHSWSSGNDFSKIAQLEGHQKAVTGINLPSGSDKLFTSSEDGTVRIWNCHTGECIGGADMGALVWCLVSEGPWVFAGITNTIKAWNIETQKELTLAAPGGHVYALTMVDGALFAGLQDGSIFMWKLNSDAMSFEGPTVLKGHTGGVVSLFWGAGRLYSSSMDKIIRVWDLENMVCINTLQKHSKEVTSVLCWDQYLLSSSLDKTLKVWACIKAEELEVIYTHIEEHGIVLLSGMHDAAGKPILLCSCSNNSVRLYDLPSFNERGCVFAKDEVRTIHIGPGGQFFIGDGSGVVSVWRCSGDFSRLLDKVAA